MNEAKITFNRDFMIMLAVLDLVVAIVAFFSFSNMLLAVFALLFAFHWIIVAVGNEKITVFEMKWGKE